MRGGAVFCNPPYGREVGKWVRKAYEEAQRGATVVLLIPARTDTTYFHDYIYGRAEIRFVRGRLRFTDEDGPALLPLEEEREEIDMGKITITEKQEAIIRRLNDPLYTVEFLKEWVNRNDNVFINAPAALQAMGASGFFAAVRAIEQAKESDGENT